MDQIRSNSVTIANGESLSGAVTMNPDWKLIAVMPASTWDTAAMTFQISIDGTTFANVYNEATEYSLSSVVAAGYNRIDMLMFLGARAIKVRSGTAASATNQTSETTVTLVFWKLD